MRNLHRHDIVTLCRLYISFKLNLIIQKRTDAAFVVLSRALILQTVKPKRPVNLEFQSTMTVQLFSSQSVRILVDLRLIGVLLQVDDALATLRRLCLNV